MRVVVSVIMVVRNGGFNNCDWLSQSIKSVLHQRFTQFELIIIDDGSTDNTLEILKLFTDPRIKVLVNPKRLGLARSLNIGLNNSKGSYIAFQDSSGTSSYQRLSRQVSLMRKDKKRGVVGCHYGLLTPFGKVIGDVSVNETETRDEDLFAGASGFTSLFRFVALKDLDGFDESNDTRFIEEFDTWIRIRNSSWKVKILQTKLCFVREFGFKLTNVEKAEQALHLIKRIDKIITVPVQKKVLIGVTLSNKYKYCIDEFIRHINKLNKHRLDITLMVVDSSDSDNFYKELQEKKVNCTYIATRFGPGFEMDSRERVTSSYNIIRDYFVGTDFDYLWILEPDILVNEQDLKFLLTGLRDGQLIVSGIVKKKSWSLFTYQKLKGGTDQTTLERVTLTSIERNLLVKEQGDVFQIAATDFGSLLLSRQVVERIPFEWKSKYNVFPDVFFFDKVIREGIQVYVHNQVQPKRVIEGSTL